MKFIATADWQLGMQAHYLSDEARARFRQDRFEAVKRIGALVGEHDAQFVVVGGDVFETNQLERAVVARTFEALRAIPVPVVLLPGNHDPLSSASIYDSPQFGSKPDHVHVLRDAEPFEVLPGVQIVGAPWVSKAPGRDLLNAAYEPLTPTEEGSYRVLLGHGAVSTLDPDRDNLSTIDVASLEAALAKGKAQFAVIGDKHSATRVSDRIWYPGTPEVTHRREEDPGNVLLVTLDGENVDVEKLRTGAWQFRTISQRIDSADDVLALRAQLDAVEDKARTAVWLALEGTISTSTNALLEEVIEYASDVFARIEHWERHKDLAVVPDGADFKDLDLSGYARAALEDLLVQAKDDDTAVDALGLLYRFTEDQR